MQHPEQLPARFWEKVDMSGGPDSCWPWIAAIGSSGYGVYGVRVAPGKWGSAYAHRLTYEQMVGPIPKRSEIDHLCRNRTCVNPLHLEAVAHKENCLRGVSIASLNAAKTHCYRGHPFNEENTHVKVRKNGARSRECRTCRNIYKRDLRKARTASVVLPKERKP